MKNKNVPESRLATWVYSTACKHGDGAFRRLWRKLLLRVRNSWTRLVGDSCVVYRNDYLGEMVIPLSRPVGFIMEAFPYFGMNLERLAVVIGTKYKDLRAIDIGANIGDTARILVKGGCRNVLCLEGACEYLPYLYENCRGNDKIEIVPMFVSWHGGSSATVASGGTLRFEPGAGCANGGLGNMKPLSEILDRHNEFTAAHLLKIDTDGLDLEIIKANISWLSIGRPVIFFEYLPFYFKRHTKDAIEVLVMLARAGYRLALIYDKLGEYVTNIELDETEQKGWDVLSYFEANDDSIYADIAVFHADDSTLFDDLRNTELRRKAKTGLS